MEKVTAWKRLRIIGCSRIETDIHNQTGFSKQAFPLSSAVYVDVMHVMHVGNLEEGVRR